MRNNNLEIRIAGSSSRPHLTLIEHSSQWLYIKQHQHSRTVKLHHYWSTGAPHVSKILSVKVSGTLTINTDPGMANVCLYRYALQNSETT